MIFTMSISLGWKKVVSFKTKTFVVPFGDSLIQMAQLISGCAAIMMPLRAGYQHRPVLGRIVVSDIEEDEEEEEAEDTSYDHNNPKNTTVKHHIELSTAVNSHNLFLQLHLLLLIGNSMYISINILCSGEPDLCRSCHEVFLLSQLRQEVLATIYYN